MTGDSTPTVPVFISSLSSSQEEEVHINITAVIHTTPEASMHAFRAICSHSSTNIATGCYLVCATWYTLLVACSVSLLCCGIHSSKRIPLTGSYSLYDSNRPDDNEPKPRTLNVGVVWLLSSNLEMLLRSVSAECGLCFTNSFVVYLQYMT